LPTEAEWEYAARFVDGQRWRRFAWGDTLPPPPIAENLGGEESRPATLDAKSREVVVLPGYRDEHPVSAPIGSYGRSATGIADLGGNVSEWMHDTYATLLDSKAATDPMGSAAAGPHSIRGANWRTASITELRLASRDRANEANQTLGFRVARYAEAAP
jgi:formylglycine-generating enzyme required for sulfatase activity